MNQLEAKYNENEGKINRIKNKLYNIRWLNRTLIINYVCLQNKKDKTKIIKKTIDSTKKKQIQIEKENKNYKK